jgi:hypothetical protein
MQNEKCNLKPRVGRSRVVFQFAFFNLQSAIPPTLLASIPRENSGGAGERVTTGAHLGNLAGCSASAADWNVCNDSNAILSPLFGSGLR